MGWDVTEVQKALKGASYPASPDDLAAQAQRNNADAELVEAVRGIDGEVSGPDQVMHELRGALGNS